MRYSLLSLADELDLEAIAEEIGLQSTDISNWVKTCSANPDTLAEPQSKEQKIEEALARGAVKIAVERHVGVYQPVYTPFGQVFSLTGKDLSAVPFVIGIGGAIINAENPKYILEGAKLSQMILFTQNLKSRLFNRQKIYFRLYGFARFRLSLIWHWN